MNRFRYMLVYPKRNVMADQKMYYSLHDACEAAARQVDQVSPYVLCFGTKYRWVYNILENTLYRSGYIQ